MGYYEQIFGDFCNFLGLLHFLWLIIDSADGFLKIFPCFWVIFNRFGRILEIFGHLKKYSSRYFGVISTDFFEFFAFFMFFV